MKIIALLSFYAERPDWLANYAASIATTGIRHIVALDGAYARFPDATASSGTASHTALHTECADHGIDLTLRVPAAPFAGDEIAKRNALYQLAESVSTDGEDWYLVLDADEWVTYSHPDLHDQVAALQVDAASVLITTRTSPLDRHPDDPTIIYRRLLRANHGLRVVGQHWKNVMPNGVRYFTGQVRSDEGPVLTLNVDHMTKLRDTERRHRAGTYYTQRDAEGWEG